MPFQYTAVRSPYVGSIGDLIAREGEIRARAAQESGQAWAGAPQAIGNTVASTIATATNPQRQLQAMQLQDATDLRRGQQTIDRAMTPTVPNGPQPEGEAPAAAQHPYLDDNGLADPTKITQLLQANGLAHLAPDLLKGVEAQNTSILQYKQHQEEAGTKQAIMLGAVANTTLNLMDAGMPFPDAASHASSSLVASGAMDGNIVQKQIAQIAQLPPDQQRAGLLQLKATAAKLGPTKKLGKDEIETDMFGDKIASNLVPEKITTAELESKAMAAYGRQANGTATPEDASLITGWEKTHPKATPVRSEPEQALDAYAKSLGKTKAEDLTDAERQTYTARDAKQKAAAAFNQHVAEHTYDAAHPAPVKGKSQDELEQEARGVLRAEFSSRSGGLGIEDQKVNQAIHLRALLDQYDGKNMPAQIQAELALGLARLTSPGGNVGAELEKEFNQRTLEGGISKSVAWLTGDPTLVNATPEKLREMFTDSINRQGTVAEQNRQTYLNEMIAMLPTQLEPARRAAITASVKPNLMPAPKGAPADGTQRNGATWKHGAQGWGWYK